MLVLLRRITRPVLAIPLLALLLAACESPPKPTLAASAWFPVTLRSLLHKH